MALEHRDITLFSRWAGPARELYREAFPARERFPFPLLRLAALSPANRLWAHLDGGELVGLSFHSLGDAAAFVLYLAVDGGRRSRGYGSRILESIIEDCGGLPVSLDVEDPGDGAGNAAQRLARVRFYERNGFRDSGHIIDSGGERCMVMTAAPEGRFDPAALERAIATAALGARCAKVEPRP